MKNKPNRRELKFALKRTVCKQTGAEGGQDMVNANYYSYVQSFSGYYNVTNGKTGKESEIKGSEGFVQSLGAAYDRAE